MPKTQRHGRPAINESQGQQPEVTLLVHLQDEQGEVKTDKVRLSPQVTKREGDHRPQAVPFFLTDELPEGDGLGYFAFDGQPGVTYRASQTDSERLREKTLRHDPEDGSHRRVYHIPRFTTQEQAQGTIARYFTEKRPREQDEGVLTYNITQGTISSAEVLMWFQVQSKSGDLVFVQDEPQTPHASALFLPTLYLREGKCVDAQSSKGSSVLQGQSAIDHIGQLVEENRIGLTKLYAPVTDNPTLVKAEYGSLEQIGLSWARIEDEQTK